METTLFIFLLSLIPFYDGIGQAICHATMEPLRELTFRVSFVVWSLALFAMHPDNCALGVVYTAAGYYLWMDPWLATGHTPT